jgi:hypothetical protein
MPSMTSNMILPPVAYEIPYETHTCTSRLAI